MNAATNIKPATLSSALVKALSEIEGAAKDKVNPHFKSKYADIASVIDAIKPVLARHGLAFTQSTEPSESGVIVETLLWHESGGDGDLGGPRSLGKLYVPANKLDAQGFGSALTYARRYALMTAFGVPAEDDDGNAAASSTKAANANPSTGEAPPEKRAKLAGPYTSKTQLWAAVRQFVRTINGCGDLGELIGFLGTKDVTELLEQCERDAPELLRDGLPSVPEYVPLELVIAQRKRDLEQVEDIHNTRTVLDAG